MTTLCAADHPLFVSQFLPAHRDPAKRRAVREAVEHRCRHNELTAEQTVECVRAALTCLDNGNSPSFATDYGFSLAKRKRDANEEAAARQRTT